jgi:hypothetical protein
MAPVPDGGPGVVPDSGTDSGPAPVLSPLACSSNPDTIYLLDEAARLVAFDPATLTSRELGILDCPGGARAWRIAIDHHGSAWMIGRVSQVVYRIDLNEPTCASAGWTSPAPGNTRAYDFTFVATADEPADEQLFVLTTVSESGGIALGVADLDSGTISAVGSAGILSAGMAGDDDGNLWVFDDWPAGRIVQLDRTDAHTVRVLSVPDLTRAMPTGFGLAYWHGALWVFSAPISGVTEVWRVDPNDGSATRVLDDIGFTVVGAALCPATHI